MLVFRFMPASRMIAHIQCDRNIGTDPVHLPIEPISHRSNVCED